MNPFTTGRREGGVVPHHLEHYNDLLAVTTRDHYSGDGVPVGSDPLRDIRRHEHTGPQVGGLRLDPYLRTVSPPSPTAPDRVVHKQTHVGAMPQDLSLLDERRGPIPRVGFSFTASGAIDQGRVSSAGTLNLQLCRDPGSTGRSGMTEVAQGRLLT